MEKIKEMYENFKEWWTEPRLIVTTYWRSFVDGFFIGSGIVSWCWIIVLYLVSLAMKLKLKFAK